jgi:hypothetical protein
MGTKADRDSGISQFVGEILENEGLALFEKWFDQLQKNAPDEKITDAEARDGMLGEIVSSVSKDLSLILDKKDKRMVEELVNRFLKKANLNVS